MSIYFTDETEKAIIKYNISKNQFKRNILYKEKIQPAFNKLVENIIYSFKLSSKYENYRTLKDKVIGELVLKIDKFEPNRIGKSGKPVKAFSFFGTVAKNFIMLEWKKENKNISLHNFDYNYDKDEYTYNSNIILSEFCVYDNEFENVERKNIIIEYLKKEQLKASEKFGIEEKILDALEEAFRQDYGLIIENKKALFLYLREFTGLTTIEISSFLTKFRPGFKQFIKDYSGGNI